LCVEDICQLQGKLQSTISTASVLIGEQYILCVDFFFQRKSCDLVGTFQGREFFFFRKRFEKEKVKTKTSFFSHFFFVAEKPFILAC
jgi:hypothetical protein